MDQILVLSVRRRGHDHHGGPGGRHPGPSVLSPGLSVHLRRGRIPNITNTLHTNTARVARTLCVVFCESVFEFVLF